MMNGKTLSAAFELKSNDSLRLDLLHHLYCEKENWWNSAGLHTVRIHGVHQERIFGIYRRNRLDHDWCAGVEKSVRLFRSCIRFSTAVHLRIHLYVQACFLSLGKRQIILSLFLVVLKVSVAVNNICVAGCGSGWRSCSLMVLAA